MVPHFALNNPLNFRHWQHEILLVLLVAGGAKDVVSWDTLERIAQTKAVKLSVPRTTNPTVPSPALARQKVEGATMLARRKAEGKTIEK